MLQFGLNPAVAKEDKGCVHKLYSLGRLWFDPGEWKCTCSLPALAGFISTEVGLTAVNSDICLGVGSSALPKQIQKTGGCVVKKQAWESVKLTAAELEPTF